MSNSGLIQIQQNVRNKIIKDEKTFNNIKKNLDLDIKNIKIIHGRNGGVLRKAVHEYLKHNKNVESYRLGNYYEGSYGVTIIKLK